MYSVKNVKLHTAREGQGVNCDLYRDRVKVAYYRDAGEGGQGRLDRWLSRDEEDLFDAFVKRQPDEYVKEYDYALTPDTDLVMGRLIAIAEKSRIARKRTLYRTPGEPYSLDSWSVFKAPYSQDIRDILESKHGPGCVFHAERAPKMVP